MDGRAIYESSVEYYVDYKNILHIFVSGHRVATINRVEGSEEYINNLVDKILHDLGYIYIK